MNNEFEELISYLRGVSQSQLLGKEAHVLAFPQARMELYHSKHATPYSKQSAVLILFYLKDETIYFTLIRRPKYNGYHSGQVALPGGKFESKDVTLRNTAIREAIEEIGVKPDKIDILNHLSSIYIPGSDFVVKPYLAAYKGAPEFSPSLTEVEYLIEVRLDDFLKTNLKEHIVPTSTQPILAPTFSLNDEHVWGATAMILTELQMLLKEKTLNLLI